MKTYDTRIAELQAAAVRDCNPFTAKVGEASLSAALDVWLKRVDGRKLTDNQRTRLLRAIARGTAPETKDVQLLHSALLRAAGLDERPAGAAAYAAGATFTELGAIWGMTQQGASKRLQEHVKQPPTA
ncbi:Fis family transcriptional regulator [Mycobacteroides abscessus subsp. abscessus]|uniref:Fis family transcriptional regulator n=1 Tax=Mycobacteroides abscessus TaxID=36809 RepID=UPI0009289399|nr:Fis family transcriptional regulator [Mycobacteroides abscessus]SIJ20394.1 Fis family transcriptional regulator [Mycobacteroides abscessus subsp. abscessus]SLH39810.1 Fis family transcriptional regulator [Mycobacteroides abscessus subsp. abscessus]